MSTSPVRCLILAFGVAVPAAAGEWVVPILASQWPGKSGNVWSSEVYLTNPGPATVTVSPASFIAGKSAPGDACPPSIPQPHAVPPYSTVLVSQGVLNFELGCPASALGAVAFDADGPVLVSGRVGNEPSGPRYGDVLNGFGQDVPGFGPADLTAPGAVYQLPRIVWDPFRCGPPRFEAYLYFVNPGPATAEVTLQQARDRTPFVLAIDGVDTPTPTTFTMEARSFRQMRVALGGAMPAVCLPPQVTDLFFKATGPVAAVASVIDRSTQEPRTVAPVRTAD